MRVRGDARSRRFTGRMCTCAFGMLLVIGRGNPVSTAGHFFHFSENFSSCLFVTVWLGVIDLRVCF